MRYLLILFTVCASWAQTLTYTLNCSGGPGVRAGATVTCPVVVSGTPTAPAAPFVAAQGLVTINASVGSNPVSWTIATPLLSKQIVSSAGSTNIFLLYGMNAAQIPNGTIATITFTMPNSPVQVSVTSPFAADANGGALAASANPPVAVTLLSNCDINGDGLVNQGDVAAIQAQILANPPSATLNITNLQKVQNAVNGATCTL